MHLLKEGELLRVVGPVGHDVLQDVRQTTVVQVNQALQLSVLSSDTKSAGFKENPFNNFTAT
jgi:hypothetical protein